MLQSKGVSRASLRTPAVAACQPVRLSSTRRAQMARAQAAGEAAGSGKIGVLFVCLGNICRSPSAEAMFKSVVEKAGLSSKFDIDSCGTGGGNPDWYLEGGWSYHQGDPADERMTATAKRRGVLLTSRSRPLQPLDLTRFDYVIGMEGKNVRAVQAATDYWAGRTTTRNELPTDCKAKLSLMTDYCRKNKGINAVPDPYYSGMDAFEKVLDLLEDACEGLLEEIKQKHSL